MEVILNKEAKTLTIRDNGIGMTAEEIDKYINQIAFSGAEEFVKQYEGKEGRIIVCAAGNSGGWGKYHVQGNTDLDTSFVWIEPNPSSQLGA